MNRFVVSRGAAVTGLLVGAAGIGLLWLGGVEFPIAVPPGLVILLVGAALVAGVRRTWTAWLACALGVFVAVGFVVSGFNGDGFDHLLGRDGFIVALGQVVQLAGVLLAAVSGAALARSAST
jgi:hypothetical protein